MALVMGLLGCRQSTHCECVVLQLDVFFRPGPLRLHIAQVRSVNLQEAAVLFCSAILAKDVLLPKRSIAAETKPYKLASELERALVFNVRAHVSTAQP